jgi:DNA-binding Lrp family transcriptional regulator
MSKLKINLNKQGLLSGGPSLILRPLWAMSLGSIAAALLWEQLNFMSGKEGEKKPVRISYSGLEKQLPFFSRRWLIETVKRLEKLGALDVIRSTRVNQFDVSLGFNVPHEPTDQNFAHMVVFPELANKVGLTEAIVLQQIHIRQWDKDGRWWFRRPLRQWHSETFMFVSPATVQRVFARLEKDGLLLTKVYISESGKMKSYRLNYLRLAEVMDIDAPVAAIPSDSNWVNPLYPI